MTFVFMRHGRTDYNAHHLLQGQTEIPLNAEGIQEAREVRKELQKDGYHFDRVISSPLGRAVQTAAFASGFTAERISTDPRLIEIGFGPMEGVPASELGGEMQKFFQDPVHYEPPQGAESYQSLLKRLQNFLDSYLFNTSEETVLALSHGAALHAVYLLLTGKSLEHFWDVPIGNCGYFEVSNSSGHWEIVSEHMHGEAWVPYTKE